MPLQGRGFWLVLATFAAATVLWLLPDTRYDLSPKDFEHPPKVSAFPRLMSDDLPKKPFLPPTEPFANGWSEPSPAAIVEQGAARAAREILERQSREMMDKN